ncbi:hypothetical protein AB0J83_21075, partial [Actinoplanes sp. NPDC049596]|uniref:hypothetical protein n=1 Tax=Actinoplanes sp. NPDC049596 TaxID=3154625 RepID=UPI003449D98E
MALSFHLRSINLEHGGSYARVEKESILGVVVTAASMCSPEWASGPRRREAESRMEAIISAYSRPLMRFLLGLTR